jgi:NAD(P)-dependent dehydrogenase (short-subunit alcohol dehydrogenase family)
MTAGGALAGKVCVVTGGGTGIGAEIARVFAGEGCRVVVAGRRRPPIEAVATEIEGFAHVSDVTDEDQVRALFGTCDRTYGRLDILVNSAADRGPVMPIEEMDVAGWDETMALNIGGIFLCTKHAIPFLKRQGGSVINLSSVSGLKGKATRGPHAASKSAVNGFTQAVAFELGQWGIRINALCPGGVAGERFVMSQTLRAKVLGTTAEALIKSGYTDTAALDRLVEPGEVASAALFLASDAALAITGELLVVDCGRLL